eukprot:Gb_24914 [translate_table: standard]
MYIDTAFCCSIVNLVGDFVYRPPVVRLEDEADLIPSDTEMEKENGNLTTTKVIFKDDEGESGLLHSKTVLEESKEIEKYSRLSMRNDINDGNVGTEGQHLSEQVEMDIAGDQETFCQEGLNIYMKGQTYCTEANKRHFQEDTDNQDSPPGGGGLYNVSIVGDDPLINTDHLEEDTTNKDLGKTVDQNIVDKTVDMEASFSDDVPDEGLKEVSHFDPQNTDKVCIYSRDIDALSVKEPVQKVLNKMANGNGVSYKLGSTNKEFEKKRALTIDTDLLSTGARLPDIFPDSSSQFLVDCENGIKLYVDLNNRNTEYCMKTQSYEFCSSEVHECIAQWKGMKGFSISDDTSMVTENKLKSRHLTDLHVLEVEKASNLPLSVRDGHLGTSTSGFVASTSPQNIPKKIEASREHRRMSSVLIPPHGANRCLSPLLSHGASRPPSPVISHGGNIFLSFSSAGRCRRQSYDNQKIDQDKHSSEGYISVTPQSSKAVKDFCVQSKPLENESLCVRKQYGFSKTKTVDETAASHAYIAAGPARSPSMNDADTQDVEMVDHELCGASGMKILKREREDQQGVQSQEEVCESVKTCKNSLTYCNRTSD